MVSLLASAPAVAVPVAVPDCTVEGNLFERDGLKLDVAFHCRASRSLTFEVAEASAAPFISRFEAGQTDGVAQARYHVDLSAYARAIDSPSLAVVRGSGVLATLGSWLLEPRGYDRPPDIDIRMATGPGLSFASGLPKVGEAWRLAGTTVRFAGYSALGRFTYREFAMPAIGSLRPGRPKSRDAVLRVAILDGIGDTGRTDLLDWVERTAEAQSNYWQGFTANQVLLGLVPVASKRGVGFGRTLPGGGVTVMVEVGTDVDRRRLFNDWVLTHELIHTAMPFIRGRGTWLMEGAATYVEPIIRARAGWKTEQEVWHEWMASMPQGLRAFSAGLASASGRENYWGGAAFMLLADLALRRATDGTKGLEDCLRGVLWSGLDGAQRVRMSEFVAACDRATGTNVVATLVDRHFSNAAPVDLPELWKELGVSLVGGQVVLDDSAPGAPLRRMIVAGDTQTRRVKLPWQP